MLRNTEEAEDAVQEIFIDIWKNAERFDASRASETTFVAMIARRRLIDKIRYSTRRISADSLDDVLLEPFTRADKQMQASIEAQQAAHQEISDATGMPLGTVKTHARRGLIRVREFLGLGETPITQEVPA